MLKWFEHAQVYHPDRLLVASGAELGRPFEDVTFEAGDRTRLHGWFFPSQGNSNRSNLSILYCHGNGGNISYRLDLCRELLSLGVAVFMFDYRGYGKSEGLPGEQGTYLDAQAAYQWLRKKGYTAKSIIAFGESLGGGVATELAVRDPVRGLVLQSTFSCIPDIGTEIFPWLPVRWLSTIKYETCAKLPRLKIPVLIMHSRRDELVGFHHAEKNFRLANEPKLLWEIKGEHNDPLTDPKAFAAGMEKFMRMLEVNGVTAP